MSLLEIKNLRLEFGSGENAVRAVDDVSLSIEAGETVCLVGESGSGKSVTALSIARLVPSPPARYVSGEIRLDGRDVLKMSKAELRDIRGGVVSYVFQEPGASLNPVFRVGNQIKEALTLHKPRTPNLVAADVRRLITPNPKSEIRNPKSMRASSRRLLRFRASGPSSLRLAQAEIACLLVGGNGDLQASVVGRRDFDGALPVRQVQARGGFQNESGGRKRPGNHSRGAVAAHNGELNASGGAGVQHYRHAIAISDGEVEFTISIKVAYRDGVWTRSRTVIEGGLESTIAVAQQHRDAAGE